MVHGNVWMEENEGRNPVFIILKIKTKENKEKHRKQTETSFTSVSFALFIKCKYITLWSVPSNHLELLFSETLHKPPIWAEPVTLIT